MPTPSYPVYFPFASGDLIDSDKVYKLFYRDTSPADSLLVVNGRLTAGDVASDFLIDADLTQRGSHVDAGGSAGTAALDYLVPSLFSGYTTASTTSFDPVSTDPFKAVPGACKSFYLKWDAQVLFQWSVFWFTENNVNGNYKSRMFFGVDGTYIRGQMRQQGKTYAATDNPKEYSFGRSWNGHYWATMSEGWHDAGIYHIADYRTGNTRVHSASLDMLAFKT